MKIDKNSYQSVFSGIDKIFQHEENPNNILFNSTDGHISINIVITNKLLELGSDIIVYDRFANTYNLHKKDSITKYKIKNIIDIKNHLILKGYSVSLPLTIQISLHLKKEKNT